MRRLLRCEAIDSLLRGRARRVLATGAAWLTAALVGVASAATPPAPLITILEGPATVLDGRQRFGAVAGQPLAPQAIVETGPDSRLMRIEWPDGRALNLGPDTRVMIEPTGFSPRGKPGPALYLLQGWVKMASAPKARAAGIVAPAVQVEPFEGIVVLRAADGLNWVFVQAGEARATDRQTRRAETVSLRAGALYERPAQGQGVLHERATSAQLKEVPRTFRDTLPSRYTAASALKPEPVAMPSPTYEQLQAWMTAERGARHGFVRRFARLLRDREFRRGVDANLDAHPEWRPILYPPPPPPPPSAPAPRPAAR